MKEIIKKIGMIKNRNRKDDNSKKEILRNNVVLKVFRANRSKGDFVSYDSFEVPDTALDNCS